MEQRLDSATQQHIEDFHRRLDAMTDFYQDAIMQLARDRMTRDLETYYGQEIPIQRDSSSSGLVRRIGSSVRNLLSRHGRPGKTKPVGEAPTVIVINPIQGSHPRNVPSRKHSNTTKRSIHNV